MLAALKNPNAMAALKKAKETEREEKRDAPPEPPGGAPMDPMAELKRRLAMRNRAVSGTGDRESQSEEREGRRKTVVLKSKMADVVDDVISRKQGGGGGGGGGDDKSGGGAPSSLGGAIGEAGEANDDDDDDDGGLSEAGSSSSGDSFVSERPRKAPPRPMVPNRILDQKLSANETSPAPPKPSPTPTEESAASVRNADRKTSLGFLDPTEMPGFSAHAAKMQGGGSDDYEWSD